MQNDKNKLTELKKDIKALRIISISCHGIGAICFLSAAYLVYKDTNMDSGSFLTLPIAALETAAGIISNVFGVAARQNIKEKRNQLAKLQNTKIR